MCVRAKCAHDVHTWVAPPSRDVSSPQKGGVGPLTGPVCGSAGLMCARMARVAHTRRQHGTQSFGAS